MRGDGRAMDTDGVTSHPSPSIKDDVSRAGDPCLSRGRSSLSTPTEESRLIWYRVGKLGQCELTNLSIPHSDTMVVGTRDNVLSIG